MPRRPRMGKRSCSRIVVTSFPSTVIRPESGSSSPSASFRIVLLPDPATPNRALVSPTESWKDTARRTALSSKDRCTSSNTMAGSDRRSMTSAVWSRGRVGADIRLPVRQNGDQQLGNKEVGDQDQHGRGYHRLRRCPAHALRAAACGHAVIATDGCDNETKHYRLEQSHENVL